MAQRITDAELREIERALQSEQDSALWRDRAISLAREVRRLREIIGGLVNDPEAGFRLMYRNLDTRYDVELIDNDGHVIRPLLLEASAIRHDRKRPADGDA